MQANNLEFFTSEELVSELVSRTTFAGIVIKAKTDVKSSNLPDNWQISVKGLNPSASAALLASVILKIQNNHTLEED